VLAWAGERVARDLGGGAGSLDERDTVRPEQHEIAVVDLELVAVECAHGRSGRAVSLGVVLTAVAGAPEAGGLGGDDSDGRGVLGFHDLLLFVEHRPARLDGAAEVRATVREDREARHAVRDAVVADERRPPRHLTLRLVAQERRDLEPPLGKVFERAEVDALWVLVHERRRDHEPKGRHGDEAADHRAQAERRAFEEHRPRVALGLPVDRRRARDRFGRDGRGSGRTRLRLDLDGRRVAAGRVSDPERRADNGDRGADRGDVPAEDQAEEQARRTDRKADRPEARTREMLLVAIRFHGQRRTRGAAKL
jgi:hypothetical protein